LFAQAAARKGLQPNMTEEYSSTDGF